MRVPGSAPDGKHCGQQERHPRSPGADMGDAPGVADRERFHVKPPFHVVDEDFDTPAYRLAGDHATEAPYRRRCFGMTRGVS
jgi:hypothetical protein